jgi:hypothetical protein
MDPVTVIVTALSLGAQTAFKSTVETAVKDAYAGLKPSSSASSASSPTPPPPSRR